MSDINWKDGAVCYAYCNQFHVGEHHHELASKANHGCSLEQALKANDFQLNEMREGDFIPAAELDTEQKYNEVVEVFGLFGFKRFNNASYANTIKSKTDSSCLKVNPSGELICNWHKGGRKLTYHQIIATGKLKQMMLEREVGKVNKDFNESEIESVLSEADKAYLIGEADIFSDEILSTKSSKAYELLESLGYGYDLNKKRWFHKVYV